MAGPMSPSADGPTFAPPHPPPGWIAQWDGASRKYYYVQLSTGRSQWELPTEASDTSTPGAEVPHPFGMPPPPPEIITHADGSQTMKHADGRMEPILSSEDSVRVGVDGPTGDRGLTSMAVNALLGGAKHSSNSNSSSSPLGGLMGGLASQVMGGSSNGSHGNNHNHGSSPLGGLMGGIASQAFGGSGSGNSHSTKPSMGSKLAGALASNILGGGGSNNHGSNNHGSNNHGSNNHGSSSSSSSKPPTVSHHHSNSNGGSSSGHHTGDQNGHSSGFGSMLGGVSSLLGKPSSASHGQGYGYSNPGHDGSYHGQSPASSYQQHHTQQSSASPYQQQQQQQHSTAPSYPQSSQPYPASSSAAPYQHLNQPAAPQGSAASYYNTGSGPTNPQQQQQPQQHHAYSPSQPGQRGPAASTAYGSSAPFGLQNPGPTSNYTNGAGNGYSQHQQPYAPYPPQAAAPPVQYMPQQASSGYGAMPHQQVPYGPSY